MSEQVLGRDFDEERAERFARPRTFKMGGKEFTFKVGFRPEIYAEYVTEYFEVMFRPGARGTEMLAVLDRMIPKFLDSVDDSPARWEELRARHIEDPEGAEESDVTIGDMHDLIEWLMEQQTGRPTRPRSSSGNGRGRTGQSSTDPSSSGVVVSEA